MDRCPKCHSFGVAWDRGMWRCPWRHCVFFELDYDKGKSIIENAKHPFRFREFIKSIKRKTRIA